MLNTLKKVYRVEQKAAQDHKAVRELPKWLIEQRIEDIEYVRGVISYIINYITANPAN